MVRLLRAQTLSIGRCTEPTHSALLHRTPTLNSTSYKVSDNKVVVAATAAGKKGATLLRRCLYAGSDEGKKAWLSFRGFDWSTNKMMYAVNVALSTCQK